MARLLIPLLLFLLLDTYVAQAFAAVFPTNSLPLILFWVLNLSLYASVAMAFAYGRERIPKWAMRYVPPSFLALSLFKLLMAAFLLLGDLIRGVLFLIGGAESALPPRSGLGLGIAMMVAAIPFLALLWGMLGAAYAYEFKHIPLRLRNLPDAFRGLRIVQLSDIHSGSLDRPDKVREAVKRINALEPDLIFFTGDLVNMVASEMAPYEEIFQQLRARHGVYSITGNHDYGDYVSWPSQEAKVANFSELRAIHGRLGWRLLMNEHERLQIGDKELAIIGIENWSAKGNFPKYGNLAQAHQGSESASIKLLLSHDPSHWKAEVLEAYPDIDVMFAGHTHGFQFGLKLGRWQWSPGQYVYREWAGLYKRAHQLLYVNRGFGYTFYPGRVGMPPEVSVFTLEPARVKA